MHIDTFLLLLQLISYKDLDFVEFNITSNYCNIIVYLEDVKYTFLFGQKKVKINIVYEEHIEIYRVDFTDAVLFCNNLIDNQLKSKME